MSGFQRLVALRSGRTVRINVWTSPESDMARICVLEGSRELLEWYQDKMSAGLMTKDEWASAVEERLRQAEGARSEVWAERYNEARLDGLSDSDARRYAAREG